MSNQNALGGFRAAFDPISVNGTDGVQGGINLSSEEANGTNPLAYDSEGRPLFEKLDRARDLSRFSLRCNRQRFRTSVASQLLDPLSRPALAPRRPLETAIVSLPLAQSDPVGTRTLLETARRVPIDGPVFVTRFESLCEDYSSLARQAERVVRQLDSLPPPPAQEARRLKLLTRLEWLETKIEMLAEQLFGAFARILGFPIHGKMKYDKGAMDTAIEACFGSLDKAGSNTFTYGPIKDWSVHDTVEVNRVFSLYLGRKVFCPVRSSKKESALQSFFERVTSVPPVNQQTDGMLTWLGQLAELLFPLPPSGRQAPSWSDFPPPLHGSGSMEVPRSGGGKRAHYYSADPRDPSILDSCVKPQALYTGGKIRVITIDSARNLDFAWINQYMQKAIRRCRWSIFGRSVEEWIRQNPDFLRPGPDFVSGDLESATDLFSGACARTVLRAVANSLRLTDEQYDQMLRFTTDADLLRGLKLDFEKGVVPDIVEQTRGQLMGSILSFPILCLVSFAAATHRTPVQRKVQALLQKGQRKAAYRRVKQYGGCGVNGDDVVHRLDPDLWVENVEAIGGRASRGKSLRSAWVFTVNSEVWSRARPAVNDWVKPSSIRPSLLCAMLDGEWKPSSRDWLEYARNPLLDPDVLSLPRAVLKPHLPPSLGGCGVYYQFDNQTLRDVAATHEARWELKNFAGEWVYPVKSITGRFVPVDESKEELALEPRVKCVVPQVDVAHFQNMCYKTGYLHHDSPPPSFGSLFRTASKRFNRSLPFLSSEDRVAIKATYDRACRLHANQQRTLKLPLSVASEYSTVSALQFDRVYPTLARHHSSSSPTLAVDFESPKTATYSLAAATPVHHDAFGSFPLCGVTGCQNPRRSAIGFFCAQHLALDTRSELIDHDDALSECDL